MKYDNLNKSNKTQEKSSKLMNKTLKKLKQFYFPFLTEKKNELQREPGTRQINQHRVRQDQAKNDINIENPRHADLNQLLDTDLTTITTENAFKFNPSNVQMSLDKASFNLNRRCTDEEFAEMDLGCEAIDDITPLEARVFMLIQSVIVTTGLVTILFVIANALLIDWIGMSQTVVITSLGLAGLIMWLTRKVFLPKVVCNFIIESLPIYKAMKRDAMLLNLAKHKLYVFFTTQDLSMFTHLMERNEDKEIKYFFDDLLQSQQAHSLEHIFIANSSTQVALDVLDTLQSEAKLSIKKCKNIHLIT